MFHDAHWYHVMANINLVYQDIFPKLIKAKMLHSIPSVKPCELSLAHHFWEEELG